MTRRRWLAAGGALALLLAVLLADGTDVIDLPEWANVEGIDVPLIGDTDQIDCRLRAVDGADLVEVRIVDGDESTYADYVHVWRNGNLLDAADVERVDTDLFRVPGEKGVEQFYAISTIPDRADRLFCESIIP